MKDAKQRSYQRERYINAIIYFCRITWRCERKKRKGRKTSSSFLLQQGIEW
jgi:hypothetical protein